MASLSEDLVEMIDVSWQTWVVLEIFAGLWCWLLYACDKNVLVIASCWVIFEYGCLVFMVLFYRYLVWMEINLADPAILSKAVQKSTHLLATENHLNYDYGAILQGAGEGLPGWTKFRTPLDRAKGQGLPPQRRGALAKALLGPAPNRAHMVFVFQENGHSSHLFVCRLLLLLQAVYVAMLLLTFMPAFEKSDHASPLTAAIGLIVVIFPLVTIQMLLHPVVRLAIHIGR